MLVFLFSYTSNSYRHTDRRQWSSDRFDDLRSRCIGCTRDDRVTMRDRASRTTCDPSDFQHACATIAYVYAIIAVFLSREQVPVNPGAQLQRCSLMLCSQHVPPFWHGFASHAFDMGISHRDAVNPSGQWHEKPGWECGDCSVTAQVPPFWHLGTGPVWHGFFHWQYGPTNNPVQLRENNRRKHMLVAVFHFIFQFILHDKRRITHVNRRGHIHRERKRERDGEKWIGRYIIRTIYNSILSVCVCVCGDRIEYPLARAHTHYTRVYVYKYVYIGRLKHVLTCTCVCMRMRARALWTRSGHEMPR
jgi:hypothetical protein